MTAAEHAEKAAVHMDLVGTTQGSAKAHMEIAQSHALVAIALSLQSTCTPRATLADVIEGK